MEGIGVRGRTEITSKIQPEDFLDEVFEILLKEKMM